MYLNLPLNVRQLFLSNMPTSYFYQDYWETNPFILTNLTTVIQVTGQKSELSDQDNIKITCRFFGGPVV